jgi:ABC-type branched-subunit amino acid transport system ATPase component
MSLLLVENIHRRFDGVVAIDDASLAVEAGTITGLIGPNGAGKTTLFNVISGLVAPDRGSVRFGGQNITSWPPDRISRHGLVRSFQIARGFPRLTVLENLLVYGHPQPGESLRRALLPRSGAWPAERALLKRAEAVAARLALDKILDLPAGAISGGQKKLLEIGRVLMAEPQLILLDEPIAGVSPTLAKQIAAMLRAMRDDGYTILVIEHNLDLIASTCDPVIVMAEGRQLTSGRFAEIAADRRVQDAYMGKRS